MVDASSAQRITGFPVMVALQSSARAYVSGSNAFSAADSCCCDRVPIVSRRGVAALFVLVRFCPAFKTAFRSRSEVALMFKLHICLLRMLQKFNPVDGVFLTHEGHSVLLITKEL